MLMLQEYRKMEKWPDYTELKRSILKGLHKDKWDKLSSLILKEEMQLGIETEILGAEFDVELAELESSYEDPNIKTEKFK